MSKKQQVTIKRIGNCCALHNYEWDVQWWADNLDEVDWDSINMSMYVKQMISLFRRYVHSYGGTFGDEPKEA